MFPAALRARLQAQLEQMLTDVCSITRQTDAVDALGARTQTWVIVATNVKCRVIRAETKRNIGQQVVAVQEALTESYRLIVPRGTSLSVDYRVTLTDGRVYDVVQVLDMNTDALDAQAEIVRRR